jgi:hypothetical protein
MASTKDTQIFSGIFLKLEVIVAFLKFVEIAIGSIQLTQFVIDHHTQPPMHGTL